MAGPATPGPPTVLEQPLLRFARTKAPRGYRWTLGRSARSDRWCGPEGRGPRGFQRLCGAVWSGQGTRWSACCEAGRAKRMARTACSRSRRGCRCDGCKSEAVRRFCTDFREADGRYQLGDVRAEALGDAVWRAGGVLDVVQQGGTDHSRRHANVGDDGGYGETVGGVRISTAAGLPLVPAQPHRKHAQGRRCRLGGSARARRPGRRPAKGLWHADGVAGALNQRRAFMTLPRRLSGGRQPIPEEADCGHGRRVRGHRAPARRHLG
ncbi:UNVERIFIED_CONTAM: hypothetical protein RKD50_008724 [Streptomyces canus]